MRFVKDQEFEPSALKELNVALTGEEKLELLHVREQNAGLFPRFSHHLARADFLSRINRLTSLFAANFLYACLVFGPRRARRKPNAGYAAFVLRGFAHVHSKRDSGARQ